MDVGIAPMPWKAWAWEKAGPLVNYEVHRWQMD